MASNEKPQAEKPQAMVGEWSSSGAFFGAILAGLLLGLLGDWLAGTGPWLVITGVVAGFVTGFYRMMDYAKQLDELAEQAQRDRYGR